MPVDACEANTVLDRGLNVCLLCLGYLATGLGLVERIRLLLLILTILLGYR